MMAGLVALWTAGGVCAAEDGGAAAPAGSKAARPAAAKPAAGAPVDVNAASVEALAALPGVGPSLAQRIVDYRKEHGPFRSVDDLLNVRGIGEKSLARFRDRVVVGGSR